MGRCIDVSDGILCCVEEDSEDEGPPSSSRTSFSFIDLTATQGAREHNTEDRSLQVLTFSCTISV